MTCERCDKDCGDDWCQCGKCYSVVCRSCEHDIDLLIDCDEVCQFTHICIQCNREILNG